MRTRLLLAAFVGLFIGYVAAMFMANSLRTPVRVPAETNYSELVRTFRDCVARLPARVAPGKVVLAQSATELRQARKRVINVLAEEADCASHTGIGGLTPAQITDITGFPFQSRH